MTEKEKLEQAARKLKALFGDFVPAIVIALGSGLGYMAEELLEDARMCQYTEIPNCPVPGATGHAGKLWWGKLSGVPVVMLQGRVHLYEGYTVHDVVFLTRLMIMLGVKRLIMTHATGGVTLNLEPGDIVGVRSHIPLSCPDPTSGPGIPELGVEFTAPVAVLDPQLLVLAKRCALRLGISFQFGVATWQPGRSYQHIAEGEYLARLGADVVTMSTIPEVRAAAQMGAVVLDLALVTDMLPHLGTLVPTTHEEVLRVVESMKAAFGRLVAMIVKEMGV